jgi:hypothetical protein
MENFPYFFIILNKQNIQHFFWLFFLLVLKKIVENNGKKHYNRNGWILGKLGAFQRKLFWENGKLK